MDAENTRTFLSIFAMTFTFYRFNFCLHKNTYGYALKDYIILFYIYACRTAFKVIITHIMLYWGRKCTIWVFVYPALQKQTSNDDGSVHTVNYGVRKLKVSPLSFLSAYMTVRPFPIPIYRARFGEACR